MALNRHNHREPVIRAIVSLRWETDVEALAFLVTGFVFTEPLLPNIQSMKYKNKPNDYPDWHTYNDPSGRKQPGRNRGSVLICENPNCESGGEISEFEAFYTFAKQPFLSRLFSGGNLYVCPFCKGRKFHSNQAVDDPAVKALLDKHRH